MVKKIFAKASSRGIPTMLDIDSPVVDIGSMPCADHVWFSREAWRKHRIPIKDLQARFGGVVGITDGDRPVTWCDQTGKIYYHTPPHVKATNTLGAGDVFRARMALAICIGASVEDAVPMACLSACEHITGKQLTKVL
jgi:sugar/nucleoside kinase (ribokinase family)